MLKLIFTSTCLLLFSLNSYAQFKLSPSFEIGIVQRSNPFELSSDYRYQGYSRYTYQYNSGKHFRNFSLSLALKQLVLKKRISVQIASYFRYNHLYYGKNSQGISSFNEREYKRIKYDIFTDGLYHFKKRKHSSVGIELGIGIGFMNLGTRFKDSTWRGNDRVEVVGNFRFLAPRVIVGLSKGRFSFFTIAHGTPDPDYRSNPSIWLEFKAAYSFYPFKKGKPERIKFAPFAQFKNAPKINIGLAYRPVAIELSALSGPGYPPKGYIYKGYSKNNNPYLVVELNQKFNHERWALQFSNYLTHRYLGTTVDSLNRPLKDLSSLSYDAFLDLQYEFRFFKNTHSFFYIGAGIGFMNNARSFKRQVLTGSTDSSGKEMYRQVNSNLSFLAPRISFGYSRKTLSVWLIAHGIPDKALESNPTIWAELKLLHSFQLKKKKI